MSIITDIKPQKNKQRINLYLDGSYFCGLQTETVMKNKFKIGSEITKEILEQIQLESESVRAFENSLRLLDRKQYSEFELKNKLKTKGYLDSTIDKVIIKLKEYQYIDDRTFAKNMVKYLGAKSKREIIQKLKMKGINREVVEFATDKISNEDELESCINTAKKHSKIKEKNQENKIKTFRYLTTKGFGYEMAKIATDKCYGHSGDEDYD